MKKIILLLAVMFLCAVVLVAEPFTSTFYVGNEASFPDYHQIKPINMTSYYWYFTKIAQTSTGFYEVELSEDSNSIQAVTYQVKKGDVIPVFIREVGYTKILVTDIKPNQITLQEQK